MSKLSYEEKVNLYNDKKKRTPLSQLIIKYKVNSSVIKYSVRLIDRYRLDALRTTKNKYYSIQENEKLRKENLYLKAELEYSKKLRAVVQARKNQQQKKKYHYTTFTILSFIYLLV